MRFTEELIDRIVHASELPSGRRRRDVQRELRAHIEDCVRAAREAGRDSHEIESLVLASFGNPRQIASGFAWVYRHERRMRRALACTLSTVFLASLVAALVLTMQTGLALGFGTPVVKVLAGRHTLIEALDILASVAVYLGLASLETVFRTRRFQNAALLLTAIFAILTLSCTAAGLPPAFLIYGLVNGIFLRALQLFVAPRFARCCIAAICFPLAGLALTSLRASGASTPLAAIGASWFVMGAGYQIMTHLAPRFRWELKP